MAVVSRAMRCIRIVVIVSETCVCIGVLWRVGNRLLLISKLQVFAVIIDYIVLIVAVLAEDILYAFFRDNSRPVHHLLLRLLSLWSRFILLHLTIYVYVPARVLKTLNLLSGKQNSHGSIKETNLASKLDLVDLHMDLFAGILKSPLISSGPHEHIVASAPATVKEETAHVGARATANVLTTAIHGAMTVKVLCLHVATLIVHHKHHQHHCNCREDKHGTA